MLLAIAFLFSSRVYGQTHTASRTEVFTTWETFVSDYLETTYANADADESGEGIIALTDRLEQLYTDPININLITKSELVAFPFLTEAQADSILAYRQKYRLFRSLGELQTVSGLMHDERRWLSLFVYVGDTLRPRPSFWKTLIGGKHELSARLDIPLYKRAGQRTYSTEELRNNPNLIYLGNSLANTVRYRYKLGYNVAYGVTLQKDAGEPFGMRGNYPYDYVSAYFHRCSRDERFAYWLGDFEVSTGLGLLLGNSFIKSRTAVVESLPAMRTVIRPHTSTTEAGFMRGGAAQFRFDAWRMAVFLSWTKPDGTLKGDTLSSFKTDGLHRTWSELQRRRVLNQLTVGMRMEYLRPNFGTGITLLYDHYSHTVWPTLRAYNRYYLRGKSVAGFAADYHLHRRKWDAQGELTLDDGLHPALTHTVRYTPKSYMAFTLQARHFSSRHVAPHAEALAQSSQPQNETGLLLGSFFRPMSRLETTAYADLFFHRRPAYRATTHGAKGIELFLKAKYLVATTLSLTGTYKWKSRQQDVAGYAGTLQYVNAHRLRLAASYTPTSRSLSLHAAVDALLATNQITMKPSKGWMLSGRASYTPLTAFSMSLFAATFFTDDYSTRLYAYEPQLRYSNAFPSFAYHGLRVVGVFTWQPLAKRLYLSARYGLLHYFNKSEISSGTQLIDSSSQNDLALQMLWRF